MADNLEYGTVTDLESHKARHVFLHRMLDELLGDWITHTGGGFLRNAKWTNL